MRKREGPRSGRGGSLPARTRPADRPLRWFDEQMLDDRFTAALAARDGRAGAHCVHEWWMRGAFPAAIESALQRLWDASAPSVPDWLPMRYVSWLPLVYEVAGRFEASGRGRHNLYLVLLDYTDRRSDSYGLYVGMSRYAPAERFDQHKAGIRAAGSVLKRGLEVLPGPVLHLQRIPRAEAARIEIQLAEALADAGLLVRGGH